MRRSTLESLIRKSTTFKGIGRSAKAADILDGPISGVVNFLTSLHGGDRDAFAYLYLMHTGRFLDGIDTQYTIGHILSFLNCGGPLFYWSFGRACCDGVISSDQFFEHVSFSNTAPHTYALLVQSSPCGFLHHPIGKAILRQWFEIVGYEGALREPPFISDATGCRIVMGNIDWKLELLKARMMMRSINSQELWD